MDHICWLSSSAAAEPIKVLLPPTPWPFFPQTVYSFGYKQRQQSLGVWAECVALTMAGRCDITCPEAPGGTERFPTSRIRATITSNTAPGRGDTGDAQDASSAGFQDFPVLGGSPALCSQKRTEP